METSREPVVNAATVASGVTAVAGGLLTLAVVFHWITPDDSAVLGPALGTAVASIVGIVSTIAAAVRARRQVTPLADPRAPDGTRLVRETYVGVDDVPGEHSEEIRERHE